MSGVTVDILGGSGYVGGEFLRLALGHPSLTVRRVTSREHAGYPIPIVHPNLRGVTDLRFSDPGDLLDGPTIEPSDVLVSALPHGGLAASFDSVAAAAGSVLLDLSEDFRLPGTDLYDEYHRRPHPRPDLLGTFVYAVPELNRERLRGAARLAGAGCNATASLLALLPLVRGGLLDAGRDVIIDAKIGSSAAGKELSAASHHPERAGAVRTYAATGHRHEAELRAHLAPVPPLHMTATAIPRVRGVLATVHAFLTQGTTEADVLQAFRDTYADEPFVRLVRARRGTYRQPDPKILDGSNYCDVGFAVDERSGRVVALAALDNLVKGAAGHAMQSLNIALGLPEAAGLSFAGLHP